MMMRALALASLLLLPALLLVCAPAARADTSPPEVLDRWWEPRYPIAPENVALYARVSDPDGVQTVGAVWCYVPPYLCQYPSLYDDGTNGDVVAGDGLWTNGSVDTDGRVIGASFKLDAFDTLGNNIHLDAIYALFVDSLNLTLESPFVTAEPGQLFTIGGTALYEENASAPAEGVSVSVSVSGSSQVATVAADGIFTATLTAPTQQGVYTITATAADRGLADSKQSTLAATSTPTPDLAVANLRTSVPEPVEGPVYLRFDARNVGTEAATNVHVLVELVSTAVPVQTLLDDRVAVAGYGGSVPVIAETSLEAGTYTVRVSLDSEDAVGELDETNNVEEFTFTVRDLPEPTSSLLVAGVGGGVAGVAAAAGVLVWRRRRLQDAPDGHGKG
jgi:hypothetical protein